MSASKKLENKVAVITGATSGMALVTAKVCPFEDYKWLLNLEIIEGFDKINKFGLAVVRSALYRGNPHDGSYQ